MTNYDPENDTEKDEPLFRKILYIFSFNIRLIVKNISHRKRSTLIVILGLIFSLSILYTASIWTHTSEKIIADDYIDTLDYEMYITSFLTHSMDEVYTYVTQDSVVEQVDWLYPSVALFNFDDKNDTYRWFPEDDQENMTNPLSISSGFVVSSRSLNRIKLNLEIEGKSELSSGEIMISYTQAKQLEAIFNETIAPGYKIDVAITRRIPNTDEGEVYMLYYDITETKFYNYTIAGIYKYVGHNKKKSSKICCSHFCFRQCISCLRCHNRFLFFPRISRGGGLYGYCYRHGNLDYYAYFQLCWWRKNSLGNSRCSSSIL